MTRLVWVIRVVSKNFVTDFGMSLKNIVGGRLKSYEYMVDTGVSEAYAELIKKWGVVENVRIETSQLTNGSVQVIVYGSVNV